MRRAFHRLPYPLLIACCLLLLAACAGNGNGSKTNSQQRSAPTATPTAGEGQQLLAQAAQLLDTAQTLHGVFDSTISGQIANGEVDSEVWRLTANSHKSRTLVQKSTLSQFASGTLIVSDGQQMWQYNPAQQTVYRGPVNASGSSGSTSQSDAQGLILGAVQTVFTHSTATLLSASEKINGHPVYTIQVAPQSSGASSGLNFNYSGTVSLDQQTHLPRALNLTVQGFAQVQMAIPSLELNKSLDSSLFAFTPPAGTKVEPFPTSTGASNSLTLQQAEQQAGYHLLSIPATQTAYHLQSLDGLGSPGNQIYTLTYTFNGQNFTLSEGKALANLPLSGQSISLRGTTATFASSGSTGTLSWTEKGVGIQLSGPLSKAQLVAVANLLV